MNVKKEKSLKGITNYEIVSLDNNSNYIIFTLSRRTGVNYERCNDYT